MRLRRTKRTRLDPTHLRLPLIALIDVVLFLLFYFIIAGNIDDQENELAATLALVGNAPPPPDADTTNRPHILAVTGDVLGPAYRIAGEEYRGRDELLGTMRAMPKDVGVVIRSSPTVPFEMVAAAMQIAHDAGFEKITYLPEE